MPELNYGKEVILPVVVIRKVTKKGAVLHKLKLVSQWGDWSPSYFDGTEPNWSMDDTLSVACNDLQMTYETFEGPFEYRKTCGHPVVTNVLLIRLKGKRAALFRALIDLLELPAPDKDLFDWLGKVAALNVGDKCNVPVQALIEEVITQVAAFNIPRVIPLGKSEANPT